jgi:hypothetical protein
LVPVGGASRDEPAQALRPLVGYERDAIILGRLGELPLWLAGGNIPLSRLFHAHNVR